MFPSKNGLFLRVETFESSQKCPESLDCFLSQTTKFLINPFTRRCTLTNFQGGGTRNPQEGNTAVCLRVGNCEKNGQGSLPRRRTNTKTILNCSESTEQNTEQTVVSQLKGILNQYYTNSKQYILEDYSGRSQSDPHFGFWGFRC